MKMPKQLFSISRMARRYRIYSGTVRSRIKHFFSFENPLTGIHDKGRYGLVAHGRGWGFIGLTPCGWITQRRLNNAEVDWLLECLLRGSPQEFSYRQIKKVVAASLYATYRKGIDLRWILHLDDGRFAYLRGWYDPTGLEYRTMLEAWFTQSPEEAAQYEIEPWLLPGDRGLYAINEEMYKDLMDQLQKGQRRWDGFMSDGARSFRKGPLSSPMEDKHLLNHLPSFLLTQFLLDM